MKVYLSYSAADSDTASVLRRLLAAEHTVLSAAPTDGPGEIIAKIRSSELVVSYSLHPTPNTSVELGVALGSGRPTVLVGSVGEPSIVDAFDLPSVVPTGSPLLDAHAVVTIIERLSTTLPTRPNAPVSLAALAADPGALDSIDYKYFEDLVWHWFVSSGANPERIASRGADFRLRHASQEYLVEVKKLSRQGRVPVDAVRSLSQAIHHSGSAGGILVTSSPLTSAARSMAEESSIAVFTPVELVASSSVSNLLDTAANRALTLAGERQWSLGKLTAGEVLPSERFLKT